MSYGWVTPPIHSNFKGAQKKHRCPPQRDQWRNRDVALSTAYVSVLILCSLCDALLGGCILHSLNV